MKKEMPSIPKHQKKKYHPAKALKLAKSTIQIADSDNHGLAKNHTIFINLHVVL